MTSGARKKYKRAWYLKNVVGRPDAMAVSRSGVYYDVTNSPHIFVSEYGEDLKFSSAKKLEMFEKQLPERVRKVQKVVYLLNSYLGTVFKIKPSVMARIEQTLYSDIGVKNDRYI